MVASSSWEDSQSILAEVMKRCRLPEEERRNYVRRMSRALLFKAAEVRRLCNLADEAEERRRERP